MPLRRGGSEDRIPGGDYYRGERHQLTVLVAFNDRSFIGDEAATLEKWDKIFNTKDYREDSYMGSVHDYFYDQSYGDFSLVFDLVYVQVPGDAKKYASTASDDENSQYLVEDIVDVLKTQDIDWDIYDWNSDGYVNQLLIIYAGEGMNVSSEDYTIWPHQWWMSEHLLNGQQGVYCEPIPVSSGEKDYLVDSYCCVQEIVNSEYFSTPFGTICHEYSHCFGFPDFYANGLVKTVDNWDLMDMGNYNGDGYQPAGYSAHERWLMGWLEPIELEETTTITDMPALADQGRAYLIRNDRYESEYYIVENRQPMGWDVSLPGSGILIFHIDFDPSVWTSTKVTPNSYDRKRYDIFHANKSIASLTGWAYPYQENNSLTNTSSPAATLWNDNEDGTKLMSKPITNMSVINGLASFDFTVTATGMDEVTTGSEQLLYHFGTVDIIRDAKGNIRKLIRK